MKIAIVDDTTSDIEVTRCTIAKVFPMAGLEVNGIECFTDGKAFADSYVPNTYDMIFMDIIMDSLDGISAAEQVRSKDKYVKIVFSSTSNEYASESYRVKADYYLLKPLDEHSGELLKMLKHLDLTEQENKRYITITGGTNIILRNIVYTEYFEHIIDFHLKDGSTAKARMRQLDIENTLLAYPFFAKCSKGTVVNLNEVKKLTKDTVLLSDGTELQISRRRQKDIENIYADFVFNKLRKELPV